jgi:cation transport protein ChaC
VGESGDLWVFGYGSLMWRPGFDCVERHVGTLHGWRRRLCVYSHVHRGTPDRPGLVLGLDRGGACRGVAFRVAAARRESTIAYLRERELVTHVYREITAGVRLDDGRRVTALTYVCDPRHPQFAGRLEHDALLRFIRQGHGVSGANRDYVRNTAAHLVELGISDAVLARLARELE